jgi:integrase
MGSLYKHKSVRWVDSNGRRVKKGTDGAFKKVDTSKKYWCQYRDAEGKLIRTALYTDKTSSIQELAKLQKQEIFRKAGLSDRHTEHAIRPLSEHIREWLASLKQTGVSERRISDMSGRIDKLMTEGKWRRLNDITDDSVRSSLAKLDCGIQTWNHYLQHIKQFVNWCVPERLLSNPIRKLKRRNVNTDRRHDRRELTQEEQKRLIESTRASTVIRSRLGGASRAMLYQLALATGFRRNELKSLKPESFDLDSDSASVTVAAGYSKHRKQDNQPLPPWIVKPLKAWLCSGNALWPDLTRHTAKMLKADLEAAGVEYVTIGPDGPLYADFHSMRHTYVTSVSRTTAPLKDQMEMTRHGTPSLFLKTYAKTNQQNKSRVANQLADPCPARSEQQDIPTASN